MRTTKHIAQGIASLGRGEDKVLVHMTPDEVEGLQKLALASGGSLTINPDTGLLEASWLGSILPVIAGIAATALAPATGGASLALWGAGAGALTGAGVAAAEKRNIGEGALMGALGGWGGTGIGSALAGAGQSAATAAQVANAGAGLPAGTGTVLQGAAGEAAQLAPKEALMGGIKALGQQEGRNAALYHLGQMSTPQKMAAAAGTLGGLGGTDQPSYGSGKNKSSGYYVTQFNPGEVNPKFGEPGESYFLGRGYEPGYWIKSKKNPFQSTVEDAYYVDPGYKPFSAAGGGLASLPKTSGLAMLSRFIQGPGDGVSDSIPATIEGRQPAALGNGEFVVDARTVSELGNGSSEAGARQLYSMMRRVHQARRNADRGEDSNATRFLPV